MDDPAVHTMLLVCNGAAKQAQWQDLRHILRPVCLNLPCQRHLMTSRNTTSQVFECDSIDFSYKGTRSRDSILSFKPSLIKPIREDKKTPETRSGPRLQPVLAAAAVTRRDRRATSQLSRNADSLFVFYFCFMKRSRP